ncbi:MAG: DUF2341 domain-containing protein [Candidatus Thorarchaeota archaeon]
MHKSTADEYVIAQQLADFDYRKSHSITGTSGAGSDYQVRITVHYGSGSDSSDNVYLNENCQSDFDDIRFTDNDGVTYLNHWREEYVVSNYATFWVQVSDDLDSDVSIFIYYGNSEASSASDGELTFIAWDDFDTGYSANESPKASRGWLTTNQSLDICRVETNPAGRSGMGLRYTEDGAGGQSLLLYNQWVKVSHDVTVHFHLYWETMADQFVFSLIDGTDWYPSINLRCGSPDYDWQYHIATYLDYQDGFGPNQDTWYEIEQQSDMVDGSDTSLIVDGVKYSGANNENANDGFDSVRFNGHANFVDDFYIDDLYVRKFNPSGEPSHGVWGPEEANSITTTTSTTTPTSSEQTPPPPPIDFSLIIIGAGGASVIIVVVVVAIVFRRKGPGVPHSQQSYDW